MNIWPQLLKAPWTQNETSMLGNPLESVLLDRSEGAQQNKQQKAELTLRLLPKNLSPKP